MEHAHSRFRDALALVFASLFPLAISCLYFLVFDDPESPAARIAYGLGKAIQFGFPAVYVWCYERERLGIPQPTWRGVPLGVGFALLVATAMFTLYFGGVRDIPAVRDETPARVWDKVQQFGLATPLGYLAMSAFLSGVHSLGEEYYWRWFVFGTMRRHMPVALAVALSSIGFMLHHVVVLGVYFPGHFWTLAVPFSLCVAVGGAVWAWSYHRGNTLYAPWLSHALVDAAILTLGFIMLQRYWP